MRYGTNAKADGVLYHGDLIVYHANTMECLEGCNNLIQEHTCSSLVYNAMRTLQHVALKNLYKSIRDMNL